MPPPIPKEASIICMSFLDKLKKYAKNPLDNHVFELFLKKIFFFDRRLSRHPESGSEYAFNYIRQMLCLYALDYPHIYQFCEKKTSDHCWTVNLADLKLSDQPGLSRFKLLGSKYILDEAICMANKNHATTIALLEKAAQKYSAFPALLWLHDYYREQICLATDAISSGAKELPKPNVEKMYLTLFNGKIHGTPFYVLIASFCYWCARYYRVSGDEDTAALYYQAVIRYLVCASQTEVISLSRSAIVNASFICHSVLDYKSRNGMYNVLSLLAVVTEGKTDALLGEMSSIFALNGEEIVKARHQGLADARQFAQRQDILATELSKLGVFSSNPFPTTRSTVALGVGSPVPKP